MTMRECILSKLKSGDEYDKVIYKRLSEDVELDMYHSLDYRRKRVVHGYRVEDVGDLVDFGHAVVVRRYSIYLKDEDVYIMYIFTVELI